jgi:ribosomal protein S18 acetylase RimI-like enzyme
MIRKMEIEDIIQVQQIDKICFNNDYVRRFELFKSYIEVDGCSLVYEENGKIVGYICNHLSGSFAWFGTLGVHTEFKGRGIGKSLVKATIEMFQNHYKINNIGLVTMPQSGYNIGFYMGLGFIPKEITLRLNKLLDESDLRRKVKDSLRVDLIDMNNDKELEKSIRDAKKLTNGLYEGLDMSSEIKKTKTSNMGIAFNVYEEDFLIGFGILRNKSILEEEGNAVGIRLVCLKANLLSYNEAINAVLIRTYKYCMENKLMRVTIDVSTIDYEVCSYLFKYHNFKVEKTSVTLIMGDESFYSNIKGLMCFKTVT